MIILWEIFNLFLKLLFFDTFYMFTSDKSFMFKPKGAYNFSFTLKNPVLPLLIHLRTQITHPI